MIGDNQTAGISSFPYSVEVSSFIGLLCIVLTIGCILGNGLVILAVLVTNKLRTPTNYLIVSLATSDLLVGAIVLPLSIVSEILGRWPFGPAACSMFVTFDVILCTASILNLMMISIDRYLVITRPFQYSSKRTSKLMVLYIVIAWAVSLLISVTPLMVGWNTIYHDGYCLINQEIGYQIYATLVAFYLPLFVMIGLYGRIFVISARIAKAESKNNPSYFEMSTQIVQDGLSEVFINNGGLKSDETGLDTAKVPELTLNNNHSNDAISSLTKIETQPLHANGNLHKPSCYSDDLQPDLRPQSRRNSARNSQAIKTLGVIMGLFTACWLPFFILAVVRSICAEHCSVPNWVTSLLTWLGYINSCLNPIIYARFNQEFRTPFKEILCFRCSTINQSVRKTDYLYLFGPGKN